MRRLLIALISLLLASTTLVAAPSAVGASPTNVAATPGAAGVLDVMWTASPDGALVDYKVQADQGGSEVTSVTAGVADTSAQLTGLGNGEEYTIVVTARDAAQGSLGSDSVVASTAVVAPSGATITLDTITSTSMVATFSADDGGGTNTYVLTVRTPDAGGSIVQTIDPASSATSINALTPSTPYSVTVTATNAAGSDSAAASATTSAPPVGDPVVTTVTATADGASTVNVTWAATAGGGTNAYTTSISPDEGSGGVTASAATSTSYTGLSAGTTYTVTVTATNETGSDSGSDDATTVALPAVTSVVAVPAGATAVNVSWSATDGGGTNTYAVTNTPAGGTFVSSGPTAGQITGLAPSTAYTITVTPANEAGEGTASSASATTDAPPVEAPSDATISLGSITANSMVATFGASDGGGTNTYSLEVRTPNAAGAVVQTIPAAVSPATISSLDPNTAYSVTVTATNAAGSDTAEATATTSAGQASAPRSVSTGLVGPFENHVRVSFIEPADLAGGTIQNYTVNLSNGDSLTVGASPATFETLPADTTVTATVIANTEAGPGAASAPSNSVTTSDVPGAVTGLSAEWAGESNLNSIDVDWTAPASTGGLEITGYVVEVAPALDNPIPVVDPGETAVTIGGLEQGTSYTVTVRAQNDRGNSAGTNSDAVLVPSTPGTVTNLVVQQSPPFSPGIVLTWDLPEDDGGSPITGYKVSVDDIAALETSVGPDVTTVSFATLPVGDHNVTVQAITAAGLGAAVTSPNFEVKAFPPFDNEEDFVTQIYADFLRRAPDAGGLAFWTARVADDGSNVQEIIEAFMRSPEFSPRRGVARLYFAYFNRQPDKGGFDFWTRQISSGAGTLESASQSFASSPEFLATYGSLNNAEFVVLVYNNVLARRPDTDGFRFWLAELDAGLQRGRLMTLFSESPENVALSRAAVDVTVTYDGMLQRLPETRCNKVADPNCVPGFTFWRDQIAGNDNALTTLIRQFYFSPEYADRVTR